MTWEIRCPVFSDGPAAENLRPEIAQEIAKGGKHDGPGAIPKWSINAKNPQVQAQNRHLVAEQTENVGARGEKDPLLVRFSGIAREVEGGGAHAVAGRDAEENAIGDAKG